MKNNSFNNNSLGLTMAANNSQQNLIKLRDVLRESHKNNNNMGEKTAQFNTNRRNLNVRPLVYDKDNTEATYREILDQMILPYDENSSEMLYSNHLHHHHNNNNQMKKINRISFIELLKLIDQTAAQSNRKNDLSCYLESSNGMKKDINQQPQSVINKIERDLEDSLNLIRTYNNSNTNSDTILEEDEEEDNDENDLTNITNTTTSESSTQDNHQFNLNENSNSTSVTTSPTSSTSENAANQLLSTFNRNDIVRKNILTSNHSQRSLSKSDLNRRRSMDQSILNQHLPSSSSSSNTEVKNKLKNSISQFSYDTNNKTMNSGDEETTNNNSNNNISLQLSNWNYDELNELRKKFISLLASENGNLDEGFSSSKSPTIQFIEDESMFSASNTNSRRFSLDQNTVRHFFY
jgi:hypothetical protein